MQALVCCLGLQHVDIGDAGFGFQLGFDQLQRAQQAVAQFGRFDAALGDFRLQLGDLFIDATQGMAAEQAAGLLNRFSRIIFGSLIADCVCRWIFVLVHSFLLHQRRAYAL
ncbi:MAG: hypothetical protein R3355_23255 [Pseudomonas sp.]|uniref:hypothetical protein n=1 Tax=Pseudomonas sp. TaxID=306 RepID=UPI00299D8A27|nr:hypothetical protein [Pseudomonas sp.]MDX1726014.1 hypothetical protein [Pseudomonas sp.]